MPPRYREGDRAQQPRRHILVIMETTCAAGGETYVEFRIDRREESLAVI